MLGFKLPPSLSLRSPCSLRKKHHLDVQVVVCGLRRKSDPRQPISSGKALGKEVVPVLLSLKAARHEPDKLIAVVSSQLSRLDKKDMLEVLKELQRQDECHLSLKALEMIREQDWYKPELSRFRELFRVLWRNKLLDDMVYVYEQVKTEGLQPDHYMHRELMVANLINGRPKVAMQLYEEAKGLHLSFNEKTYKMMISGLRECGEDAFAAVVESGFARAFPPRPKLL